jgi:hypothetical protein
VTARERDRQLYLISSSKRVRGSNVIYRASIAFLTSIVHEHEPFSLERNTSSQHPEKDLRLGNVDASSFIRVRERLEGLLPFGPAVSQKGLHFPRTRNLTCPTFFRLFSFSSRNVETCTPETLSRNNLA